MSDIDPLLAEMFKKLPPAETRWLVESRLNWLRAFAANMTLVYMSDSDAEVVINREPTNG